jgi:hypothetical protein
MLRFAPEVRIRLFTVAIGEVLEAAAEWSLIARADVEITAIAAGPGVASVDSLHAYDLAVDLIPVGDKPADRAALGEWLRRRLAPPFDVAFEGTRVHVALDVHRPPLRTLT